MEVLKHLPTEQNTAELSEEEVDDAEEAPRLTLVAPPTSPAIIQEGDKSASSPPALTSDDEDGEAEVEAFSHEGEDYLIDRSTNELYYRETHEPAGTWNPDESTITTC